jgi:hypothetical protein
MNVEHTLPSSVIMCMCSQSAGKTQTVNKSRMKKIDQKILSKFKGKRKNLHYYIAGFVDGEGSFSIAILKTPNQKFGWAINPVFQVYQHEKQRYILELCQSVFGTGKIYRKSGIHPVLNFSIDSRRSLLEVVIPFFNQYPVLTKEETYRKFRDIVMSMKRGEHLTKQGFKRLVRLAYTTNQKGKGRRRTMEEIFSSL